MFVVLTNFKIVEASSSKTTGSVIKDQSLNPSLSHTLFTSSLVTYSVKGIDYSFRLTAGILVILIWQKAQKRATQIIL
jgi:hypothetical protein